MVFPLGLTGAEFARQKRSYLLTSRGCVLHSGADGQFVCEEWLAEGVREEQGLMVVYGTGGGERLDALLEGDQAAAFPAVLFWKTGLDFLIDGTDKANFEKFEKILAAPCGVFVDLEKQILFFPPRPLIQAVVEVEGAWLSGAKRWMHPDKEGRDAVNWTFAACLYRVFAGFAPFAVPAADPGKKADPHVIEDTLAGDIREGALIQANLAAPGLHEDIARFIDAHVVHHEKNAPPPVIDADFTKNRDVLPETALAQIKAQREAIAQKKQKQVRTKRFFIRNRARIGGISGGLLAVGLVVGSFVHAQAEKWSTRGLSPAEVVAAYYDAFGVLDHETMSACLQKNVGKADVELVANLFVVSKMREAYEQKRTVMNAADWDGTAPPPDTTVFGTLHLAADWPSGGATGEMRDGPITARARYDLVLPSSYVGVEDAGVSRIARDDTLRLEWQKNRWRITAIDRRERF